nr:hypothetical protein [Paracoccus kondratievae]
MTIAGSAATALVWGPSAARPLATAPAPHRQTFLPVNPAELLLVHDHALVLQHDAHAPTAEAAVPLSDLAHLPTELRVIGRPLAPHRFRIDADQNAGAALRDRMIPHRPQHRVVRHGIGQRALELRIPVLKLLQPLGVRQLHAAILRLQLAECREA